MMELLFESLWGLLLWLCVGMLAVGLAIRERRQMDRLIEAGNADLKRAEADFEFFSRAVEREQSSERFCGECRLFPESEGSERFPNSRACPGFACAHGEIRELRSGEVLCGVCCAALSRNASRGVRADGRGARRAAAGLIEAAKGAHRALRRSLRPKSCGFGPLVRVRNMLTGQVRLFHAKFEPKIGERCVSCEQVRPLKTYRVEDDFHGRRDFFARWCDECHEAHTVGLEGQVELGDSPAPLLKAVLQTGLTFVNRDLVPAVCSGCGARISDLSVLPGLDVLCPKCSPKGG